MSIVFLDYHIYIYIYIATYIEKKDSQISLFYGWVEINVMFDRVRDLYSYYLRFFIVSQKVKAISCFKVLWWVSWYDYVKENDHHNSLKT